MVVRCLLIEPNPESALNEEAGRMFMEVFFGRVFSSKWAREVFLLSSFSFILFHGCNFFYF
jgi:hypothetical protein